MKFRCLFLLLLFAGLWSGARAQDTLRFWEPATEFHSTRFWALNTGVGATYTGTLLLLNEYWYSGYDRSRFHFFDDGAEWLQMDKLGHLFNSYFISTWGGRVYNWAGLKNKNAAIAGAVASSFLMSSIEVLDGFSAKWGASAYDLGANLLGSGLYVSQELWWEEQRLRLKISAWPQNYPADVQDRVNDLYGHTVAEWILKDYNASVFWLSGNIYDFAPESPFPKWLNIAVGYGANGLLGGYANKWCAEGGALEECPPGHIVDRTDIARYRQYYLSLDVDLSKIETRSNFLRVILYMANAIKIPAPALEYNSHSGFRFHPLFF